MVVCARQSPNRYCRRLSRIRDLDNSECRVRVGVFAPGASEEYLDLPCCSLPLFVFGTSCTADQQRLLDISAGCGETTTTVLKLRALLSSRRSSPGLTLRPLESCPPPFSVLQHLSRWHSHSRMRTLRFAT
ncbi:hypothetical protein IG631_07541 [Alternaria alternata]|nr:hypothetical protein IG631_07541 [Alternaria alternata]